MRTILVVVKPPPPPTNGPEVIQTQKYMICKISFIAIGYMHLMENGTLQKGDGTDASRHGYYRWRGPLSRKVCGRDQQNIEFLLCMTEDEYTEITQ